MVEAKELNVNYDNKTYERFWERLAKFEDSATARRRAVEFVKSEDVCMRASGREPNCLNQSGRLLVACVICCFLVLRCVKALLAKLVSEVGTEVRGRRVLDAGCIRYNLLV